MDIYDPQTLGIMVFGGFMVFSAIGIALVSTFSMKETSYEEALAKQRRELGKIQPGRSEKKKKDKTSEKKSRGKKKEEKPNGKIPEQEKMEEAPDTDAVIEPVSAPVVATAPAFDDKPVAALQPVDNQPKTAAEPSPAAEPSHTPSPKEKKKKNVAKVEPGSSQQAVIVSAPALVQTSALPSSTQAPAKGNAQPSSTAPAKAVPASSKSASTPAKSAPVKAAAAPTKFAPPSAKSAPAAPPASSKSAPATPPASSKSAPVAPPASSKSAPVAPSASSKSATAAPSASSKSAPVAPPASSKSAPAAPSASSKTAPAAPHASAKSTTATPPASTKSLAAAPPASPKQASTAAKSAPTSAKAVTAPVKSSSAPGKTVLVLETVTKDVPVMAVPPVGSQKSPIVTSKAQESKKKSSKKKSEPVTAVDPPLYLPYKALVSTISSMVFSEQEAHRLIEILSEKAGIIQDTWHTATQKGDPVAILKKQLEEKEKQLAAEHEDASAAKNRLRELTKELSAEKTKVASVETRLSSQLSKREQEMIALKARMQASYQDHVAQTQRLNTKILSLQDQLEKGPNAQLARLQQENSILRDALNQATSQAESKQNAELAKLRQECAKLTKELEEKTESLLSAEHIRKGLEAKVSTAEKQVSLLQASHTESEQALQRRLEEVREELRTTQSRNSSLQVTLDKAQQDNSTLSEFQVRAERLEADIKGRCAQVDALTAQIEEAKAEKSQLIEQLASINSLLEASQNKKVEEDNQGNAAELEQLKLSLQERENQLNTLHEELKQLQLKQEAAENTIVELEQRNKSEDASLITSLQEELTNLKEEMVQLRNSSQSGRSAEHAQLQISLKEKDVLVTSLQEQLREMSDVNTMAQLTAFQTEAKESLQTLFPQIPLETEQSNWLQVFTQKAQEALTSQSQESQSCPVLPELLEKLKEAEGNYGSLQAECEQYRTVLAETEGMLKHLQKSVEEEELVWKSKMATSEEQLRVALEKVSKLEAENLSVEQLKEQMMLLEAQLEKQADSQGTLEEINELKLQLSECQSQLDLAQKESQAQKEELAQVREQMGKITMWAQHEQNGPTEAQPIQVHNELTQTTEKLHGETAQRQQLTEEFEQAQKTIAEFQAQLDLLKVSAESPQTDTEDIAQLKVKLSALSSKERLEKEKKLSKDLGQAATKLQQLLKATQEQLTKEREAVRTLQEHLEGKEDYVELKEGTSV